MSLDRLRRRLNALYRHYDHRYVDPDPLQFVRAQRRAEDREVVGLIASALAYGNVLQIKRSIGTVLGVLGARPARALRRLQPRDAARALAGFKHRFNDGRDVACLFYFVRQMLESAGSVEGFFAAGLAPGDGHVGPALASFAARTLALDHGGLYGEGPLPPDAGVRFFFPSPEDGSPCKRLNLYLRWMVRREGVDLGLWRSVAPRRLVIPLDAHVFSIARRVALTRYRSPGWRMALDITARLRRLDPDDPVKYDFALHRMGLWKKDDEIRSLRSGPERRPQRTLRMCPAPLRVLPSSKGEPSDQVLGPAAGENAPLRGTDTGGPATIATGAPLRNKRRAVSLS